MKATPILIAPLLSLAMSTCASCEEIVLWPDGAPGALGSADKDIPTLTPYLADPAKASGPALLIFPGGGYATLAAHEGAGFAEFFRQLGINCFVLKYRLGSGGYRHPRMLEDASRAVRLVRARAAEWKIDPHQVGIIGSSAGGHLASTLATHFDAGKPDASDPIEREGSRPDYVILCYPVITMGENTHAGSRMKLLGENPSQELINELSNEKRVTKDTPPCFVWHTWEDKTVKVENSLAFAEALQRAGVPYDLHIYEKGGHGMGLGRGAAADEKYHAWTRDVVFWLRKRGIVK
jgi:acetyl esterase/lipase